MVRDGKCEPGRYLKSLLFNVCDASCRLYRDFRELKPLMMNMYMHTSLETSPYNNRGHTLSSYHWTGVWCEYRMSCAVFTMPHYSQLLSWPLLDFSLDRVRMCFHPAKQGQHLLLRHGWKDCSREDKEKFWALIQRNICYEFGSSMICNTTLYDKFVYPAIQNQKVWQADAGSPIVPALGTGSLLSSALPGATVPCYNPIVCVWKC